MITAILIAALCGAAYAAGDKADSTAKKTSDGFGNLLKGMGQEVKKAGGGDAKKSDKAAKSKEDKK
jgi:hypothetical protein